MFYIFDGETKSSVCGDNLKGSQCLSTNILLENLCCMYCSSTYRSHIYLFFHILLSIVFVEIIIIIPLQHCVFEAAIQVRTGTFFLFYLLLSFILQSHTLCQSSLQRSTNASVAIPPLCQYPHLSLTFTQHLTGPRSFVCNLGVLH